MGGDEHGVRGRHTCVRARSGWWQGVYVAVKGAAFPSFATACVTYPATTRPWRRGSSDTRRRVPAQEKGTKGPVLPPPRVGVRACWGAQWRENVEPAWSRANKNTARRREREWHDAAHNGQKGRLSQNAGARRRRQWWVDMGAVPPEAARVGSFPGVSAAALIAVSGTGHVNGRDAPWRRGARRDGEAQRPARPLSPWPLAKVAKVRDDDGYVSAAPGDVVRVPLVSDRSRAAVGGGRRGWLLGRGWAGSEVGLEWRLAAR
jgi:hypothetical protein